MPTPLAAPEPASPMKCPLPMLLANSDAPTYDHNVSVTVVIAVPLRQLYRSQRYRHADRNDFFAQLYDGETISF